MKMMKMVKMMRMMRTEREESLYLVKEESSKNDIYL